MYIYIHIFIAKPKTLYSLYEPQTLKLQTPKKTQSLNSYTTQDRVRTPSGNDIRDSEIRTTTG